MLTPARSVLTAIVTAIADLLASPATPNQWKVKLFTNNLTPTPDNVIADFTVPTYTGYSPLNLGDDTPATTYVDPVTGKINIVLPADVMMLTFPCNAAPAEPQTIYGYFVTDAAGTVLKGAERFETPIVISDVGQAVSIDSVRLVTPRNLFPGI